MEYYSVIKRSAFESLMMRWKNIESIISVVLMNLFTEQQWRYRHREQSYGQGWGRRGRG